ncbi:hypothetical protein BaRGS_00033161 [Batillaria attramentaria]|uniref:Alpha-1,3-mannosyl-glycoprotein 4-beta-N-acetylglucosaminyltransferase C n=1 Tax=Batillaria attramentaria TaxID=370345 RepID=A0ABD0JKQ1_9CAEN
MQYFARSVARWVPWRRSPMLVPLGLCVIVLQIVIIVRMEREFLTIGIPTVKRQGDDYIIQTVTSLLSNMDDDQKKDVTIVILVADLDPVLRNATFVQLQKSFEQDISEGHIHVIQTPKTLYSSFKVTKQTYDQSKDYVTWRSKQNYDYAYLMRYSAKLSQYYMQLEDDVITARGYVSNIRQYIQQQNDSWTCLEFSELGFIGKLYKSHDLDRLSQLLLMFFQEQPVDYTYLYFNMLMTQLQKRLRTPTLFQHKGTQSSLPGKIQPLKDRFFDNMVKKYKGDNPPVEIYTTLKTYLNFVPKLSYSNMEGYFWSDGSPGVGDTFVLVFEEPKSIERVVIETGSESHPEDILQHGKLLASLTLLRNTGRLDCTNDIDLGDFSEGRLDVKDVRSIVKFKVMCLQIKVTREQTPWLLIREIAVFLTPSA